MSKRSKLGPGERIVRIEGHPSVIGIKINMLHSSLMLDGERVKRVISKKPTEMVCVVGPA